jgi:hypothetical protein
MYIVSSVFYSTQTSLLASEKASVFLFLVLCSNPIHINTGSIDQELMFSIQFKTFLIAYSKAELESKAIVSNIMYILLITLLLFSVNLTY